MMYNKNKLKKIPKSESYFVSRHPCLKKKEKLVTEPSEVVITEPD